MAYGYHEDQNRKTADDKVLRDKELYITKNPKYDGYQRGLASMVYNFFDKKTSAETVKNEVFSNTYLAEELHKIFIRNLRKEKYNHLLQIISEVQVQQI